VEGNYILAMRSPLILSKLLHSRWFINGQASFINHFCFGHQYRSLKGSLQPCLVSCRRFLLPCLTSLFTSENCHIAMVVPPRPWVKQQNGCMVKKSVYFETFRPATDPSLYSLIGRSLENLYGTGWYSKERNGWVKSSGENEWVYRVTSIHRPGIGPVNCKKNYL